MDYYADGGLSHVAQIAPAGAMRVSAESETGGEAYIPLAPSKRTRSLAIWEEAGRRLQALADGGLRNGLPTYVPTPPQIVHAQATPGGGGSVPPAFTPTFVSSGDQRQDCDDAWFQHVTKMGGGR